MMNEPTVLQEQRSQRDILFGFLVVVLFLPLILMLFRRDVSTSTVVLSCILAAIGVAFGVGWYHLVRHPTILVVNSSAIRLVKDGNQIDVVAHTSRQWVAVVVVGGGRNRHLALRAADGTTLSLQFFRRADVESACLAHGWTLGPPTPVDRILTVLDECIARVSHPQADLSNTNFTSQEAAVAGLHAQRGDLVASGSTTGLSATFDPNGPIRRVAIDSGWGDRFDELAGEVSRALAELAAR